MRDRTMALILLIAALLGVVVVAVAERAAADTKISAMPSAGALAGTEAIPAVQAGANVKTTPAALLTYTEGQLISGTPTAGHCVSWASATVIQDAGAACGSGGGITALTGDVSASGTGSVAATVNSYNGGTAFGTFAGQNYATPPAIGGTTPNTGAFSTLTATTVNGLSLTSNASGFQVAGGTTSKTLTLNNTLTFSGTDSTVMTFPSTSATLARTDAANTFTGTQTLSGLALPSAAPITLNGRRAITTTAPTYSSGFSTGTPTISGTNTLVFTVTIGSTPSSSGVLTMPSGASNGWACKVNDLTTTSIVADLSATTATSITTSFYGRTTGTSSSPTASDVIQYMCAAY